MSKRSYWDDTLDDDDTEDSLEHFGVKGMKWGVRKAAKKIGNAPKALWKKQVNSTREDAITHETYRRVKAGQRAYRHSSNARYEKDRAEYYKNRNPSLANKHAEKSDYEKSLADYYKSQDGIRASAKKGSSQLVKVMNEYGKKEVVRIPSEKRIKRRAAARMTANGLGIAAVGAMDAAVLGLMANIARQR